MNLTVEKAPSYFADVTRQFAWYFDEAGEELAWRFFNATERTLLKLSQQPDLGRRRTFRHPVLFELYSIQVERPFQKLLIFYRVSDNTLQAWRLMHGARDLGRRLIEPL